MNNSGAAYWLVYSFIFIFMLGIMFVVLNQILLDNVYPITEEIVAAGPGDTSHADRWLTFWTYFPIVALLVVIIFLAVKITNKEQEMG